MLELFMRCLAAKDKYIHNEKEGGDYYIEAEGDTLYILFEWSDGSEDWISNFDFLPNGNRPVFQIIRALKNNFCLCSAAYKGTSRVWRAHKGFLRVWQDMQGKIESDVDEMLMKDPRIKNIDIVGYSHGGAMALFAYEDMKFIYGDKYKIRGFGFAAPRVVFGKPPREIEERLSGFVTVRNGYDIVTHVPPRIMGYRDSGEVINIGRKHIYTPIGAHYPFAYIEELTESENKARLNFTSNIAGRIDKK